MLELEEAHLYTNSKKPEAPFIIPGVKAIAGTEINLLGSDEKLTWKQEGNDIIIENLPAELPCKYAWVFKIKCK